MNYTFANQAEIDSLLLLLKEHTQSDSVRATVLNNISLSYADFDPETGILYADSSISLTTKIKHEPKLATAYFAKAYNYAKAGKDSLAIEYYKISYSINEKNGRLQACASIATNTGICHSNLSDYSSALKSYQTAFALQVELGNSVLQAAILSNIGVVYMNMSDYETALEYYLRSLKLYENASDSNNIANTYSNIGILFKNTGNFKKAIEYQQNAVKIYTRTEDDINLAKCFNNLGNIYESINEAENALKSYQNALSINQRANYRFGTASNMANIGILLSNRLELENALDYLTKAYKVFDELGDKINTAFMLHEIGTIYSKAPLSLLRKFKIQDSSTKAIRLKQNALEILRNTGNVALQAEITESLSTLFYRKKDYQQAYEFAMQYSSLKDSVFNIDKQTDIIKMETQFRFDKKEALIMAESDKQQAISSAQIEKEQMIRNYSIAGSMLILLAGTGIFVSYKKRRDAMFEKKEAEFNAEVTSTEMKALRAQMNPHFIFNSLNSISDYINKNDTKSADTYLVKFATLIRQILENSESKEITLSKDLKALENYIQLEAMRLQNKFSYTIYVDSEIDTENTMIPPLILQPFVENSIWHGIANKEKTEGRINISIVREGNMIKCRVDDNGPGLGNFSQTTSAHEKSSMGMKITQARIDILNKIKKSAAEINFSNLTEGLRVEVKLPLISNF